MRQSVPALALSACLLLVACATTTLPPSRSYQGSYRGTYTYTTGRIGGQYCLTFSQDADGSITGSVIEKGEGASYTNADTIEARIRGHFYNDGEVDRIYFVKSYGNRPGQLVYRGTVEGDHIEGTWSMKAGDGSGPFSIDLTPVDPADCP